MYLGFWVHRGADRFRDQKVKVMASSNPKQPGQYNIYVTIKANFTIIRAHM